MFGLFGASFEGFSMRAPCSLGLEGFPYGFYGRRVFQGAAKDRSTLKR